MTGAPAVDAAELYRFFHTGDEEVIALRGVSLVVRPGELVALVGPSGSGKSTLLSCVSGLDDPDGGIVQVAGHRMSRRPEAERAALRAAHLGVVLQSGNLIEHLTVASNALVARRLAGHRGGSPGVFERVGLAGRERAYPSQLFGGESVRAALALALVNEPAVVVADEPTAEVDRTTEARLLDLLRAEADRGVALLVATHSAAVATAAHRVVELVDGRVVA